MRQIAKLPGLGPRSGRRVALHLIKNKQSTFEPLLKTFSEVIKAVEICQRCGNFDLINPCKVCVDEKRDKGTLCVVAEVEDLWAIERTGSYKGLYHVLGGMISALEGVSPEDLRIGSLMQRADENSCSEVILALNATVEGQTTAFYVQEALKSFKGKISRLSFGVPVGGELDYLDDGTLNSALEGRVSLS
mgnify:CR=1 FL=1